MTSRQPTDSDAVIVSAEQVKTLLTALHDAADYKRGRADTCADCADQSCATCQWRLRGAATYDRTAAQLVRATEASAMRQRGSGHEAADPEAHSESPPASPDRAHRQPDTAGHAMKRRKYGEPSRVPGARPPEYVIVVAASEWSKAHDPASRFNLWDALQVGKDLEPEPQPDPEPDLEAEP